MNVALLTRDLPPVRVGGVASWVHDLACALVADGRAVTVFAESRSVKEGKYPYRVASVPGRSWARWQGTWMAAALARDRSRHPIVIAATWRLATALRGPLAPRHLLVGLHGSDVTALASMPPALTRMVQQASFLPVSRFLATRLAALGGPEAKPLPWPLAPVTEAAPPRGRHLVCVSRLVEGKGLVDTVVLAGRLRLNLTVVGEGPARADAERVAQQLGVKVCWRGQLDRASARRELASAAAAVLLPSGPEGLGLCLLEAASVGTPVIGRARGGTPEAVGAGVVLPKNVDISAVDLSAVHTLLADPTAGRRALAWVQSVHHPRACLAALDAVLRAQGGGR